MTSQETWNVRGDQDIRLDLEPRPNPLKSSILVKTILRAVGSGYHSPAIHDQLWSVRG